MVSFKIKSDDSLTVLVAKEFNALEKERVSLMIESLFDTMQGKIYFDIAQSVKYISLKMIVDFCENLPYNYVIKQKACAQND